jgi:hypothetical protein
MKELVDYHHSRSDHPDHRNRNQANQFAPEDQIRFEILDEKIQSDGLCYHSQKECKCEFEIEPQ